MKKNFLFLISYIFILFFTFSLNVYAQDYVYNFGYTGNYQEFTAPYSGEYKLEVWGAKGGDYNSTIIGGKGGYSTGVVSLKKGDKIYIYVGGKGTSATGQTAGGYNGGGQSSFRTDYDTPSGGGATDIRYFASSPTSDDLVWNSTIGLNSRIIVAGGGGSASYNGSDSGKGGAGGGVTGGTGTSTSTAAASGGGGTQTSGGTIEVCSGNETGTFGKGGNASTSTSSCMAGAGGGGWYGGGSGSIYATPGGGGSGFVLTSDTVVNVPKDYAVSNKYYLKNAETISGNKAMPTHDGTGTMTGNNGDGYAKITYIKRDMTLDIEVLNAIISPDFDNEVYDYDLYIDNNQEVTFNIINPDDSYIYSGEGTYNLLVGDIHYVSAINELGEIILYAFKINNSKATLDNITFDNITFDFDKNVYNYDLEVEFDVISTTPTITKKDGVTYEITKNEYLYYGENKIIIKAMETGKTDGIYTISIKRKTEGAFATFTHTKGVQTFVANKSGYYKLEVWGAQGGDYSTSILGGKGGYSRGTVYLNKNQMVYIYVGGAGSAAKGTTPGGYNGGAQSSHRTDYITASGGGATDIRVFGTTPTSNELLWNSTKGLNSRIIVAGGGGAAAFNGSYSGRGGAGGGTTGIAGTAGGGYKAGGGGTQTSGGTITACGNNQSGSFGKGGAAANNSDSCMAGSGGGGWYGGGAGSLGGAAGGGGSGFVLTSTSTLPTGYLVGSEFYLSDSVTTAGNAAMPTHDGTGTMTGNSGDGYAKITYLSEDTVSGLKNITTNYGTLSPEFDSTTTSYTLDVGAESELIIDAIPNSLYANVIGTGAYTLNVGTTEIILTVTEASGVLTNYTISVNRRASGDSTLKAIKVNHATLQEFEPNKTDYDIVVPYNVNFASIEPVFRYPEQKVTYEDLIELNTDNVKTTLFSISEDLSSNTLYTLNIKKEQTTLLKSLQINNSIYSIDFSPTKTDYTLEISKNTFSLDMEAIPYNDSASVTIEGNKFIEDGPITVTVKNDGVEDTVYTINIVKTKIEQIVYEFPYTGEYQEFITPVSGRYLFEVWGAQGGSYNNVYTGGKGAYAKGNAVLEQGTNLYIFVGGKGTKNIGTKPGGFNGGGNSSNRNYSVGGSRIELATGAGSTDIRTKINTNGDWNNNDSLLSRFIVAGGGGAGAWNGSTGGIGGYGGTLIGGDGTSNYNTSYSGKGGTQISGGSSLVCNVGPASYYNQPGIFGKGGNASLEPSSCLAGAGGGGWYGGGAGSSNGAGGGGGSSFVLTASSTNLPENYNVSEKFHMYDTELIAGNKAMPTYKGTSNMVGNSGNGYAKITLLSEVSSNNFLESISINGKLIEDFDTTKLDYNITLGEDDAISNIEAIAKDEDASISGIGNIDIAPGNSTHEIVVTASDGSIRTYVLNIYRTPSSDPTPKDIKLEKVITSLCKLHASYCNYTFDKDTANYNIILPFNNDVAELLPVLRSKYQKVEFRIVKDTGNEIQDTGLVTLGSEQIILEVEITSEDNVNTAVYRYTLYKDPDGNNNLASLTVTDPDIPIEDFDASTYEYYIEVPSSASLFTVNAIPEDDRADVKIEGNTNLKVGMNDCIITVTSYKGIKKSYIIHAYKGQDTNVYLSNLEVKNNKTNDVIEMSPTFNKLLNEYTLEVPNDVDIVNIVATPESGSAIITGDGVHTLKTGSNVLEVEVSTSGSSDVNKYKLNIYRVKNSNPNLASIEVEDFTLSPAFDKNTLEYYVKFDGNIPRLNLKITPEESTTTYTVRGNTLIGSYNEITITAVAEDKSYKVYKIYATKDLSDNNFLTDLKVKGTTSSYTPEFDKNESNYTLNVAEDILQIEVEGIKEDKNAIVTGNGIYVLKKGENTINIDVTSEAGSIKTYTLTVNRAKNDDLTLKSVTNSIGSEVIKFDDNSRGYDYLINVQYEINQISIEGIPNASTSVVTGNGTYSLNVGNNDIILRVDSEAGNFKEYIVRVVRDLSTNDDLDFLFVEEGGLSPNFFETTISYDVKIPFNKTDVHITAIPEDANATVDIVGDTTNLEVGVTREIKVVVTAQKGNKKTYTLEIVRQEDTTENLSLETLEINRGDLTPKFNPDTLNYEITVENDITDITITSRAFNSDVKVIGNGTYNLKVGKNSIPIFVVSNTTGIQRDYQIVVTRKKSKDATLSNLVIKSTILTPSFNKNITEYNVTTSNSKLDFTTIKPTESEATYEVKGNSDFVTGENTVTITVTAPDGETKKDYVITVEKTGSKNNNLASLSVEGYVLVPVFHKGVTFYAVDVPNNVNNVLINATAEDSIATVDGTGLKVINPGENYFDIKVTSEIGTTKVYTVLVTREPSDNNYLSSITIPNYELNPSFDKEINDYEVIVPYTESKIEIYATAEDVNASVAGIDSYTLVEGENLIPIIVTSEAGSVRTYNIKVIKETPVSVYLSSLEVKDYELDTEFNKENLEYYITVNNEVNSLDLTYTLEDKKATAVVTGNENFNVGMNEVVITVTRVVSETEVLEQNYIIYVNKQMSTNNYLDYITVTNGTFTEDFSSTKMNYTVLVDHDITEVTIDAMPQDKNSKITAGIGVKQLEIGDNEVLIKVRSSIGVIRTYTLNIIREASDNNYLTSLKVTDGTNEYELTPTFNKETLEYTVNVGSELEFVDIVGTLEDNNATVTGLETVILGTGTNTFEVVVTSESGKVNVYKLNIIKAPSNNNYALNIVPSSGTLNPEFTKENDTYNLELEDVSSLSFEVTLESNKATVTGHEIKPVAEGTSVRIITITAEDGTTKDYTINVTRPSKSEARLESLTIDNYLFEFNSDTFTYNIQVSNSKKVLLESELTAVPKDPDATVNMMGDLNLTDGIVNIYTIEVIAKDGYTTQAYTLNITRDSEEYTLRTNKYEIVRFEDETEEDYVIGIQPSTVISDFKNNFENDPLDLKVYLDTTESLDTDLTATVLILKLEKNGYVYDTLRVIVRGDLTKDGKVNITDQVKMINYVGRTTTFDKYQMLAGDLTFDGKVNITDQVKIINYVGRTITDLNNKPTS